MKKSIILLTLIFLVSIGFVMAQTVSFRAIPAGNAVDEICMKYDDFSGQNLSLDKWSENPDPEGQPLMGEHFVDTILNNYHMQNIGGHDQRAILNMSGHVFEVGETLKYTLDYDSGNTTGNKGGVVFLNGAPTDRLCRDVGFNICIGPSIGRNGGNFPAGNQLGKYNLRLEFMNDGINATVIRPDRTVFSTKIPTNATWVYAGNTYSSAGPWNIGFETWASGDTHMDYDNVQICKKV
jgi:hypothetical protein